MATPTTTSTGANKSSIPTSQIQTQLGIKSDNVYGPQTTAAVKAFQTSQGLKADGIVGPLTSAALAKVGGGGSSAPTGGQSVNTPMQSFDTKPKVSPGATPPSSTSTPKTAVTTTETAKPETQTYTVKSGDTLQKIAEANKTNIQDIMKANPTIKNPNVISSGQTLTIPGAPGAVASKTPVNQYQNELVKKISAVPDQNNRVAVANAAASVPYGDQFPPNVTTTMDGLISTLVPAIQSIINPKTHEKSLVDTYKQLSSSLGIDELNTKYMNLENVINGTENDIRAEVTKAGGFATESQVRALTASRNNVLIQQANMLQEQITNKNNTLNTLMGLEEKDRAAVNDRIETATGLTMQLATLQNTIQKNANDNYDKIVSNIGYKGLAAVMANDPYNRAIAEKSLGLPAGTLANPKEVAGLDTFKEKQLALSATRINIMAPYYDARTASSYASTIKSVVSNMYPTGKNPMQTYGAAKTNIARVDAAYEQAIDAKNKNKGPADLALIDAYVQVARGGGNITEAQVDTLLKSMGVKAKFDAATQRVTGSALLNNANRKALASQAHAELNEYAKSANEALPIINRQIQTIAPGAPQLNSPDDYVPDVPSMSAGPGSIISSGGKNYKVGPDGETLIPLN